MKSGEDIADVIIIGAGPAGLSAALWCGELGLETILVEKEADIGGQLWQVHNPIENYLGVRATNGVDLLNHFRRSIEGSEFTTQKACSVVSIDPNGQTVGMSDGASLSWRALVIATGVRRRTLGIPGEAEFRGRGIVESGARDKHDLSGKNVLIIGGGDAAIENALLLSETAASVRVAFRRHEPTARNEFMQELSRTRNVEMLPGTIVKEIRGNDVVSTVRLEDVGTGRQREQAIDAILIRIGVEPNSKIAEGVANLDDRSYIIVNANCQTSVPGIFAIGDVANPIAPTINAATGAGSVAAKAIYCSLHR